MARYIISGKHPLSGSIEISGRKNAAIKLLAATLLTTGTTTLERIPDIGDVQVMLQILQALGAEVQFQGGIATINTSSVQNTAIPYDLGRKLRASLVLVGPLLARFGEAHFPHPGGCLIGKRSIDPHLDGFRDLGVDVQLVDGTYHLKGKPQGTLIYLKEKSVTGTENLIMTAVTASGTTEIFNAAEEEHIHNLSDYLRSLGYQISGDGSHTITIQGTSLSNLSINHSVISDEIEVGTFAVAALVTQGQVTLTKTGTKKSILPILSKLEDFNAQFSFDANTETLQILPSPDLRSADVQTNPYPGFFPDLQSPFTVLATQSRGEALIHDWMYEGRLNFTDLLARMGADVTVCDPHRVIIKGPTPLSAKDNVSPDLRAGAALVLAALAAKGTSVVDNVELIDRGYVDFDGRLQSLGAKIIRES